MRRYTGLPSPPQPGSVCAIELCSTHFKSVPGSFFDAHLTEKRDALGSQGAAVHVHKHPAPTPGGGGDDNGVGGDSNGVPAAAGKWRVEPLTGDDWLALPPELHPSFDLASPPPTLTRLKLVSGHFGVPDDAL